MYSTVAPFGVHAWNRRDSVALTRQAHAAMLKNFSFVVPGVLAGCAFPLAATPADAPDAAEKVKQLLQEHPIGTLVTLTEQPHPLAAHLAAAGTKCVHIPIVDFAAPSLEQMVAFGNAVAELPRPVFVHCQKGIGRTGTMLTVGVAALRRGQQSQAVSADDAITEVRTIRPGSMEVAAQVAAAREYIATLNAAS